MDQNTEKRIENPYIPMAFEAVAGGTGSFPKKQPAGIPEGAGRTYSPGMTTVTFLDDHR